MANAFNGGTALGKVRGKGAAGHGTGAFMTQRLTAVSNAVLMTWFVVSLATLPNLSWPVVTAWVSSPLVATALILLILSTFLHFRLGVMELIEDYVHNEAWKILAVVALNFYAIAGIAIGIVSVARVALTGTAN